MIDAEALICHLSARGIRLALDGSVWLIVEPASRLSDEDRQAIRAHKAELLRLVAGTDPYHRAKALAREAEATGRDLVDHIREHVPELAATPALGEGWTPAQSILATCQRHGVALHIDPDGALVVGKVGAKADELKQPWRTLIMAIEAHTDAVARLVEAGWHLRADFPRYTVA